MRLNAKAFRDYRGLRMISSARRLCVLRRLRPTLYKQKSLFLFISVV